MDKLFHEVVTSKGIKLDNIVALANAYLNIASVQFDSTNETRLLELQETCIMKCITLVHENKLHRKFVLTALQAFYILGLIRLYLKDNKRCKLTLQKAVNTYSNYTRNEFPAPLDPLIYLGIEKDSRIEMEDIHMKILVIFGTILSQSFIKKDIEKYLKYMHMGLQKQFTYTEMINYDYCAWIIESLKLANTFAINNRFIEAKHHLIAACYMFQIHGIETKQNNLEQWFYFNENEKHAYFGLTLYTVRYLILLLNTSSNRLLWNDSDKSYKTNSSKPELLIKTGKESKKLIMFSGNLGQNIEEYVHWIPDDYFLNYNEAKPYFVRIIELLSTAKKFYSNWKYNANNELLIDGLTSMAYAALASYEQKENQIKLHKQRANLLTNALKTCDLTTNEKVYKMISLQLGHIYATLLENQIENFRLIDQLNSEELKEFNYLAMTVLNRYQTYLI